ncbi:hypothetical protein AVEN_70315-1, partial [Araneus ventricosus]
KILAGVKEERSPLLSIENEKSFFDPMPLQSALPWSDMENANPCQQEITLSNNISHLFDPVVPILPALNEGRCICSFKASLQPETISLLVTIAQDGIFCVIDYCIFVTKGIDGR